MAIKRMTHSKYGDRSVRVFLLAASKLQSLAISHSISCVHVVPTLVTSKKTAKKKISIASFHFGTRLQVDPS